MYTYQYGPEYGFMHGLGSLITFIIIIAVVVIIVRLVAGPRGHQRMRRAFHRSPALDLLEERYAKGEIGKEEFETKRADMLA